VRYRTRAACLFAVPGLIAILGQAALDPAPEALESFTQVRPGRVFQPDSEAAWAAFRAPDEMPGPPLVSSFTARSFPTVPCGPVSRFCATRAQAVDGVDHDRSAARRTAVTGKWSDG
jgi:hypothetical protein